MSETKTITMTRDKEIYDAPYTADVHPDEIENYKSMGWVKVEPKIETKPETAPLAKNWPKPKGK